MASLLRTWRPLPRALSRPAQYPVVCQKIRSNTHDAHGIQRSQSSYEDKYREKIAKAAKEKGLSTSELKTRLQEEKAKEKQRLKEKDAIAAAAAAEKAKAPLSQRATASSPTGPQKSVRKDSSPVRPLSSILNLPRIMSTPHTKEQVTALWSAYHASRSGGTGRGYIYAAVPVELYHKMIQTARQYSNFVVPVPRNPSEPAPEGSGNPHEFFFLQWTFHDQPPVPTAATEIDQLFNPPPPSDGTNPPATAILFTSLQEYKLRQSFATPYLVITHYTDLAHTHGIVLLRGEITPSSSHPTVADSQDVGPRFMLNQIDAQLLALSVQKFYLWGGKDAGAEMGEKLLKTFHEAPQEFKWEELLEYTKSSTP